MHVHLLLSMVRQGEVQQICEQLYVSDKDTDYSNSACMENHIHCNSAVGMNLCIFGCKMRGKENSYCMSMSPCIVGTVGTSLDNTSKGKRLVELEALEVLELPALVEVEGVVVVVVAAVLLLYKVQVVGVVEGVEGVEEVEVVVEAVVVVVEEYSLQLVQAQEEL